MGRSAQRGDGMRDDRCTDDVGFLRWSQVFLFASLLDPVSLERELDTFACPAGRFNVASVANGPRMRAWTGHSTCSGPEVHGNHILFSEKSQSAMTLSREEYRTTPIMLANDDAGSVTKRPMHLVEPRTGRSNSINQANLHTLGTLVNSACP